MSPRRLPARCDSFLGAVHVHSMLMARLAPISVAPSADRAPDARAARWILSGHDVWLVKSGHVDVFASMRHDECDAGRRHHLFRLEQGCPLFGFPEASGVTIEVISGGAAVVDPVERSLIDEKLKDERARVAILRTLDKWVERICESLAAGMPPVACMAHGAGQELDGTAARCVRPLLGVLAVEVLSGEGELFGLADLVVGAERPLLLSSHGWMVLSSQATARFMTAHQLAERGMLWPALDELHRLALDGIRHRLEKLIGVERSRQAAKTASSKAAQDSALIDLAAAFRGAAINAVDAGARKSSASTAHDRLNAACQMVATSLGVPFVNGAATSHRTVKAGIDNVARTSNFRARQIRLSDDWWRHDQGALVGFLKEGSSAVALLPRGNAVYDLVDPADPTPRPVSPALAATLSPMAFTFYRPFKEGPVGFWQLLRFGAGGGLHELLAVVATGVLGGVVSTGIPIATGVIINTIIPSTDRSQLGQWFVLLLVGTLVSTLFQATRAIALIRFEMKLAYSVQAAVWDRLLSLPSQFFRQYAAGNLAVRANGIDVIRQTLSGATIRAVLGGVFSIFNFALLFHYDIQLALYSTAVIGFAGTVFVSMAYIQRSYQRELASIEAKTSGIVLQFLSGIRKLRVAGAECRALEIWARLFANRWRQRWAIEWLSCVFRAVLAALPLIAYAVLFMVIVAPGDSSGMKTGDVLAFLAAFVASLNATLTTAGAVMGALSIVPQYVMARPILETAPEVSSGQIDPGPLNGEIALDHVTFRYSPDAPPVLNDVSVRIKPGEFVAFVGPSGSGKSTILRLLLGFETPESGAIYYDGKDFKDLDRRAVRRQMGVVLQSGRLMPGDIYTNICGASSATMEDAWTASRMAGFDADIKRMPMGMHTMVSEGGGALSGGQRQRLMIARAIVSSPSMLFFDEATSALDNRTQATVSESLDRLRATRVVIAHRLSTIAHANQIVVVEKGRVVQTGTYEDLIAQPGLFRDLANRQLA